jgi:hypothetical protein
MERHVPLEIEMHVITRPDYPANRSGYTADRSKPYEWVKTFWGRVALHAATQWVHDRKTVVQCTLDSRYAPYGVKQKLLYEFLQRAVPELFVEYKERRGKDMPRNLPMGRVYMWFLDNTEPAQGCVKRIHTEHPYNWEKTPQYKLEKALGLERARRAG